MELANPRCNTAIPALGSDDLVQPHLASRHDRRIVTPGNGENQITEGLDGSQAAQGDSAAQRIEYIGLALAKVLQNQIGLRIPVTGGKHRAAHMTRHRRFHLRGEVDAAQRAPVILCGELLAAFVVD
jgi:hypothetical protein